MTDWQPIETAPKDKQVLIVGKYPTVSVWSDVYHSWWSGKGLQEKDRWARWPHQFQPTHWMPLPTPPNQEGERA